MISLDPELIKMSCRQIYQTSIDSYSGGLSSSTNDNSNMQQNSYSHGNSNQ